MDHGKSPNLLLKLLQLLLHKTQSTPMSFHLSTSQDGEVNMIDPKLSNTMMETVMSTPNMMDNGRSHNEIDPLISKPS